MSIVDEIKQSFKQGSVLTRLIYVNLAVFLVVQVFLIAYFLMQRPTDGIPVVRMFELPASPTNFMHQPWSLFTYMFLHQDFLHILFNLLWLFWFGQIFLQYLDARKMLSVYILGGISGGLLYMLAFNMLPVFWPAVEISYALGASASIVAIVVAISFYVPNHRINLLFFGPVKLIYIALISIGLDIISIPVSNAGGHIAHLGGAIFGYIFIRLYKQNIDISKWFGQFTAWLQNIFKPKPRMKATYQHPTSDMDYNMSRKEEQKVIDAILDKIAKGGYESLSKKEKEILFRSSKN